jgi:hypothetical protein
MITRPFGIFTEPKKLPYVFMGTFDTLGLSDIDQNEFLLETHDEANHA